MKFFWGATTKRQRVVFEAIAPRTQGWGVYLAGGTAVALRLGHRRSVDLDFFGPRGIDPKVLEKDLLAVARKAKLPLEIEEENRRGSFGAALGGVKISVNRFKYPRLEVPLNHCGCDVASIEDLAAMKLLAIGARSEKKDFVDLHEILLDGLRVEDLWRHFERKFGSLARSKAEHFHRSIVDFRLAEASAMPSMLRRRGRSWSAVKQRFLAWAGQPPQATGPEPT